METWCRAFVYHSTIPDVWRRTLYHTCMKPYLLLGAANGFCAVALGAFGAHGLKDRVAPDLLAVWNTGAQYQMYHALALILVALLHGRLDAKGQKLRAYAGLAFGIGCIVFPGSLYALTLSGKRVLGAITPLGGVCFLTGWVLLAIAATQNAPPKEPQG